MKLWSRRRGKQVRLGPPEEVERRPDKRTEPAKPDDNLNKLTPEARAQLEAEAQKLQEIIAFTEEHPEDASTVIRAWLIQKDGE